MPEAPYEPLCDCNRQTRTGYSRHLTLPRQILQWEFQLDTVQLNSEINPRTFRIF